ncbi:hypothetical protein CLV58_1171 [Spirosoma oryzae]|uniref:Uncharacterized protein n=1 Tax=Spirosoma oryzae TaxID=1469603 RepID=A0A2T0SLV6_9BACT|nr:hypothetical protein CLV58_1171 [Spirosoma oryzae]
MDDDTTSLNTNSFSTFTPLFGWAAPLSFWAVLPVDGKLPHAKRTTIDPPVSAENEREALGNLSSHK